MAFMQIHFFSYTLGREVAVNALIPQGAEHYKTLWLLHGLSDDHTAWQRYTTIEKVANEGGFAVVMPNVDRSFYTNMYHGDNYFDYIADELPAVMRCFFRGMSDKREDNYIAGLSMGGYGAFKAALTYPERYAAACSLSGALDIRYLYEDYGLERESFFINIFGSLELFEGGENDVFALLEKDVKEGKELPYLQMACGMQDAILPCSDRFYKKAKELGVEIEYVQAEGNHNWTFWNEHIRRFTAHVCGK